MLLMIDNYDSFTYNIVQYFAELGQEVLVRRNDDITPAEIEALKPQYLVIGPGPCSPREAGISVAAIQHFAGKLPIMGVCLGHQAIGEAFGGHIVRAKTLMHGLQEIRLTRGIGIKDDVVIEGRVVPVALLSRHMAKTGGLQEMSTETP